LEKYRIEFKKMQISRIVNAGGRRRGSLKMRLGIESETPCQAFYLFVRVWKRPLKEDNLRNVCPRE
jgi:hypothetical protein